MPTKDVKRLNSSCNLFDGDFHPSFSISRANDFSTRDLEPIQHLRIYRPLFRNFLFDCSRDATAALKDVNHTLRSKKELCNDASNFVKLETVCAVEKGALRRNVRPR